MSQRRLGIIYALVAYGIWGLLPLYLKAIGRVPPLEVMAHRIVWSFLLLAGVLAATRNSAWLRQLRQRPRIVGGFALSAGALSINWFVYIWAVGAGRIVDASLGYFINPLFSVLLAVVVLKERLRRGQWAAVALACLGVVWLTFQAGKLPWIGLLLASSFGAYGLLRKTAALDALSGLALETTLLVPAAAGYLWWLAITGTAAWPHASLELRTLLLGAGPITALPLLSFAAGARRIPLALVGVLQYVGPSLQLGLGVLVFDEPFGGAKAAGFGLIWLSLLLYAVEGLSFSGSRAARAP